MSKGSALVVVLCCAVACTDGGDVRPDDAGSGGLGGAGASGASGTSGESGASGSPRLAPITAGDFTLTTEVLAPLAGPHQRRAPGQETLQFYGTDLGYTFNQGDELRILFGDTVVLTSPLQSNDDAFGTLAFGSCPAGDAAERFVAENAGDPAAPVWKRPGPTVEFATAAPDQLDYIKVRLGDMALPMAVLQTPIAAFADGSGRAFALFNRSEVARCATAPGCPADVPCDSGLGTCTGIPIEVPCVPGAMKGQPGSCPRDGVCEEMGGYCQDLSTSVNDGGPTGRVLASAQRIQVGAESPTKRGEFQVTTWVTNKFANLTARTVADFDPARPRGEGNDYRPAAGASTGHERVLIWGRPNFVGAKARNRDAQLYFAVADVPALDAAGAPIWAPRYFAGLDDQGRPRMVAEQGEAVALDLSGGAGDSHEPFDIVNQMTVSWIESLGRFVMIYGGDLDLSAAGYYNPGVSRGEDGALQIRFAEQPWGPWSIAYPLLRAGDPAHPELEGGQYGPGGVLHHPDCKDPRCITGDPTQFAVEDIDPWGWLYGPNVIDCWTQARGQGTADVYWIASTWNPYQVVLLKTRMTRAQ